MNAGTSFISVGLLIFILIPLAAGITLLLLARRGGLGYPACGQCGYDVSGSVGSVTRCPECGAAFTEAGIMPPTRRDRPFMRTAGLLLIILSIGCFGSMLVMWGAAHSVRSSAPPAPQSPGP